MKDRTDGSGMINPIIDPGNVRQICCHCDLNIAESLPITKKHRRALPRRSLSHKETER